MNMSLTQLLPLLAALVSGVFTLLVFDQFLNRRKTYQIVWTIGLFFYCVASLAQFLGATNGWQSNVNYYRLWYLGGAIATSAFLGMGTVFLIAKRQVAVGVLVGLLVAFVLAAGLVFSAPIDLAGLPVDPNHEVKGTGFPGYVRALTPFFNIFGAGFLGIGALHSAWVFWRKRIKLYRVISNCLICGGAFASSSAGIISRFGVAEGAAAFSIATLLGVTLIFGGFLLSIEVFAEFRVPFTRFVLWNRRQPEPVHAPVSAALAD